MTAKSVKVFSRKLIKNSKGDIIKFLTKKDKFFKGFGEIYFSEIKKNKSKGWNFHKENTSLIIAPKGSVNFKIFEPKKKKLLKITIGNKNNNKIIQIPPRHWFSFSKKSDYAIIANFMNTPHKKNETIKKKVINGMVIK